MEQVESKIENVTMYEGHKKGKHKSTVYVKVVTDKDTRENCRGRVADAVRETFGKCDFSSHGPTWHDKESPHTFTIAFTRSCKYKPDFVSPQGLYGQLCAQHGDLRTKFAELVEQAKIDQANHEQAKATLQEVNHVSSQFSETCIKKGKKAINYDERLAALQAELGEAAKEQLRKDIAKEDEWKYDGGKAIDPVVRAMVTEKAEGQLEAELKIRRGGAFFFDVADPAFPESEETYADIIARLAV